MRTLDIGRFAWRSLAGYRLRTLLTILAISIGCGAVVVLTSLGEGARLYVRNQFSSLGSNLIGILPGRAETGGAAPATIVGRTPHDLTLDDALALYRIRGVEHVAPLNVGDGSVWYAGRSRDVPVLGSTSELQEIRHLTIVQGQFLPVEDPRNASPVCVIGRNVREELFGQEAAIGQWVRIRDRRFRVIGVLAKHGESLGLDMDEVVIVPVASAQILFNVESLLRVLIAVHSHEDVQRVRTQIIRVLTERHGENDVTVVSQDAVMATLDRILVALTFALGGIASIGLAVAGILVMNVMLIAVSQRTTEIGLLKAIGASPRQIRVLFFAEAAVLSTVGGLVGLAVGHGGSFLIRETYPTLPAYPPQWAVAAALFTAVATGIIFAVLPARRASNLEPAAALAKR